jgi:oligosaccharide repeat unit polymerase
MKPLFVLLPCVLVWWIWSRFNRETLRDWFSPLNLLLYCWVLPFMASFMSLSDLQKGVSVEAFTLLVSCTAVLLLTSLLPVMVVRKWPLVVRNSRDDAALLASTWLILPFYALTIGALYAAEFYGQDLPLLQYLSGEAANTLLNVYGKDSKLQVLAYGVYVATMLLFFIAMNSRRSFKRRCLLGMVFVVVALGFFKTSKSDVYTPILVCAALYYYHKKARGEGIPKAWAVWLMIALAATASISTVRLEGIGNSGGYADEIEFKYSTELGPVLTPIVATIYGYTSLGFQNFSNVVALDDDKWRLGTSLFRPLLAAFLQGDEARALDIPVQNRGVVSNAANVGTYLTGLYIEGGVTLCLLGSLIYGLLVNAIYTRFRLRQGGMWMFIYVAVLFPWTWIFFTNAFSVLTTYTNLFYIAAFFVMVRGRRTRALPGEHPCS